MNLGAEAIGHIKGDPSFLEACLKSMHQDGIATGVTKNTDAAGSYGMPRGCPRVWA